MANIQTNILGKVLFFYELEPIVITHTENSSLRVRISVDGHGIILDESYWPDFSGNITIDIRDIVSQELIPKVPEVGSDAQQTSLFKVFHLSLGDNEVTGDFTVNGFSSEAAHKITDVDTLRIPEDYLLPLSVFNIGDSFKVKKLFPDGGATTFMTLNASDSGVGATSQMLDFAGSLVAGNRFQIELSSTDVSFFSPVFEVAAGHFEQFLFANRYGGFDNIPMAGALEFIPELSFETGNYGDRNEQVDADSEYIYQQNSGYLSRTVMELASELLCCSHVYHLDKSGEWRRIVILESDLRTKSNSDLHSFTFRFKYSDDTRPMGLKGKVAGVYSAISADTTYVYALTKSPMVIGHGKNKIPCVTVLDHNNQEVEVSIKHTDENSVTLSWNGDLSGYAYIK